MQPIAKVAGYHAGRCVIELTNPAEVLPTGLALYGAPEVKQGPVADARIAELLRAVADHVTVRGEQAAEIARLKGVIVKCKEALLEAQSVRAHLAKWRTRQFRDEHGDQHENMKREFPMMDEALAATQKSGMTVMDIQDDDSLRFVQRVLESDAPEVDRQRAIETIIDIRTRVRKGFEK